MKPEIIQILEQYHQEQLLQYDSVLNERQKQRLEEQIRAIDFEELKKLYEETQKSIAIEEKKIEKIAYTDKEKLVKEQKERLEKIGSSKIKQGQYAVVTMAGGQGTRLGHIGPKGSYCLNTVNGPKYLFEILVDTLKKANDKYQVVIPWYIMTSKENYQQTVSFLEEHQYFGYDKNQIKFFIQGELPLVDTKGKLILDEKGQIKEAANRKWWYL